MGYSETRPSWNLLCVYRQSYIWSMRMHIGLTICHFLQSVVSITEGPKNKIMRKSGIHSSLPCWDSTLEQFLFYRVSGKNAKSDIFWSHRYSTIHLSKQHFCHKRESPRNIMFLNFFFTQRNKSCYIVLSRQWTELWMPDFLIILFFGPSVLLTTDSKKWQIVRPICVLMKFDHIRNTIGHCMQNEESH